MKRIALTLAAGLVLTAAAGRMQALADEKDVPQKIDPAAIEAKDESDAFVLPVPSEIVKKIQASQTGAQMQAAIGQTPHRYEGLEPWKAALMMGVSLADLLVSVEALPPEKLVAGLDDVLAGMKSLKVGEEQMKKVAELRGAVASGAMEKEKLVSQFDAMRAELLSTGRAQLGEQNFALLAAGGWSRAANLAARVAQDDPAALKDMEVLKVRLVLETLVRWLGTGAEVQPVVASLNKILPITSKARPEPPTAEELGILRSATDEILALVQIH